MENNEHTPGGKIFNDLDSYFEEDNLSEEDKKLLAELDAIDVNTAELAVEFTDHDLVHNSMLMGRMAKLKGHANNVDCCSYTYVINVYQKDPAASTFKYTRVYEFTDNVSISLMELFSTQGCNFIKRSTTQCFGADELHNPYIELEQRAVFVYDLIVPEGFDIDAIHYHYSTAIITFEPWQQIDGHWSSEEKEGYSGFPSDYLTLTSTSPNHLRTQAMLWLPESRPAKAEQTVIFKTQDI